MESKDSHCLHLPPQLDIPGRSASWGLSGERIKRLPEHAEWWPLLEHVTPSWGTASADSIGRG